MPQRFAWSFILGVSLLGFAAPSVANANVIFTNFGPALAYDTTEGNPVGNAFDGNNYAEANTFTPSSTGFFQSFQIALSCFFICGDAFSVALTADNGNQPGVILESFSVGGGAIGLFGINNAPLLLNSVLAPQLLVGTQYWVAVKAPVTELVAWNLNSTGDVSNQANSSDGGATWFSPSSFTPGALEVDATSSIVEPPSVPEPSTFALVGLALAGMWWRRRSQYPTPTR